MDVSGEALPKMDGGRHDEGEHERRRANARKQASRVELVVEELDC